MGPLGLALLISTGLVADPPRLPPTPEMEPLEATPPVQLLPQRPATPAPRAALSRLPFDWRGERAHEAQDVWVLEQGAIQAEGFLMLADRIEYHMDEGRVVAMGHIRLEGPDVRLRCERLEMLWDSRSGQAWALQMDLPPTWTLRSAHVAFAALRTWSFDAVDLSPCPEDQPGWKAKLSSLKVDLDGWATLSNALIFLGPVPTYYYVPWAIYPAQADRASGILPPSLGFSSAFGTNVGVNYYQVLGPTADLTLAPDYYSRAGLLMGSELRWHPDLTHEGSFSGQAIHQRGLDTTRYRFNLKEVWQREDGWQLTADVNQASDNLVDADFGKGLGRLGANSFDSALYLGRNFTYGTLSLRAAEQRSFFYTKDQGDPFYSPDFPASLRRQTLPQGEFRFFPLPVLGPLYLDGGVRLGRFAYRIEGSATGNDQGYAWDRQDGNARLHGRLGQWGPFRADFEMMGRATHYSASLSAPLFDPSAGVDGSAVNPATSPFQVSGPAAMRTLVSGHLRFSGPQVGRDFSAVSLLGYKGDLKHILEPYFGFTQTSRSGEAAVIPRFDAVDSYPGVNESAPGERSFELGLKQHLLGQSGSGFSDLIRLNVATRFHTTPIILSDGRYKKGWASVDSDLALEPSNRWRLSLRSSQDLTNGGADNALSLDLKGGEGARFNLAYYATGINRFLVRQQGIQVGGIQRYLDDRLRVEFSANYDYHLRTFASSQAAIAWVRPCVAYILKYTHVGLGLSSLSAGREDRIDLTLSLRGMGDLFNFRR